MGVRQELWSSTDSEPEDAERIWGIQEHTREHTQEHTQERTQEQTEETQTEINQPTKPNKSNSLSDIPDTLRPGFAPAPSSSSFGHNEENPWQDGNKKLEGSSVEPNAKHEEVPKALIPGLARTETNPFKRKPIGNAPPMPSEPTQPPPPPPTTSFSNMQISDTEASTNPCQPSLGESKASKPPSPLPSMVDAEQDSGTNIWGAPVAPPSTVYSSNPPSVSQFPSGRDSPNWGEGEPAKPPPPPLPEKSAEQAQFTDDQHAWDDMALGPRGQKHEAVPKQEQTGPPDGWNLIDHEPLQDPPQASLTRQESWENFADADEDQPETAAPEVQASPAPPTEDQPSATPPSVPPSVPPATPPAAQPAAPLAQPPAASLAASPDASPDVPPALPPRTTNDASASRSRPQAKSETYQIKNINWFDDAIKKTRKSPILVQNANGPCPLVALVNALTLSSPASATTNLVETLRTREQISINLLLEAVFDELISSRRTDSNAPLPDMTDLYDFLKGLQTGMNVNPRFIPSPEYVEAHHRRSPGTHIPGTFEDTRDLKLYATFSVPLIHGWLPPQDDPAYDAFVRQGSSYDEVQSLLFREEELEDKLSNSSIGLTEPEQQLYQDIITIRSWLSSTATQLTPWGLNVIAKYIKPGSVSILFRNDHFSTLYRHPRTLELLTLVTDAGYHTHDEVVWESLTDVRGERAEFFSGDFRAVGGPQQQSSSNAPDAWYDDGSGGNGSTSGNRGEWQTVQNRHPRNSGSRQARTAQSSTTAVSSNLEQEDRDLALALQLQEEEDERHRAAQAARQREAQLSEQFIEQQGRQGTPAARGGRGGLPRGGGRGGAPPTPPRVTSANQRGGRGGGRGAPQQHVRPLVPPASPPARATTTHRPADHEATDDAPPPSYEQASKTTPYVPPAGHPSHPGSSPGQSSTDPRASASSGFGRGGSGPPPGRGSNSSLRGRPAPGGVSVAPTSSAASESSSGRQDRDCIIM